MAEGLRKRDTERERDTEKNKDRERESLREYECLCNERRLETCLFQAEVSRPESYFNLYHGLGRHPNLWCLCILICHIGIIVTSVLPTAQVCGNNRMKC